MKKSEDVLFFTFVLVLSLSLCFVSSECASDEDVIVKISGENGALAGLWNVSSYSTSICYSDFFGKTYSGENPRECNGGNSLFYLQTEDESTVSFYEYEKVYTIPGATNDGPPLCEGTAILHLDKVYGCRKGRTTAEIDLHVPFSFYAEPGEKKEFVVQSNVQVRKQSNCGTFVWKFFVSCDERGKINVEKDCRSPVKGGSVPAGYSIVKKFDPIYFRSGDSKNGYKNPVVFMESSAYGGSYNEPNRKVKVTLEGNVKGCRKGATTEDYTVEVPIYFNASSDKTTEYFIQSGVRVRKQPYCNDFVWRFSVSRSSSGGMLLNGVPYNENSPVKLSWEKARVDKGFALVSELPKKFFNYGDNLNGYVNPAVYTLITRYENDFVRYVEDDREEVMKFDVPVCYGDVSCRLEKGKDCSEEEVLLASLEKEYDSKVSKGDDVDYDYKICCFRDIPADVFSDADAYWSNMLGSGINKTDKGDTVRLVVDHYLDGIEVNYTIYKKRELSFNPFNWFTRKIDEVSSVDNSPTWIAEESGEYYFEVTYTNEDGATVRISSNSPKNPYGILEVGDEENNSPPGVKIIFPELNSGHDSESDVFFEAEYYDEDDDLNLTWTFGDGNSLAKSNCLSGEDCSATHKYGSPKSGVFYPQVEVVEINRASPNHAINKTSILIYSEGINLFPIIDAPKFGDKFDAGFIRFSANSSFVANCTTQNSCTLPEGYVDDPENEDFYLDCYSPGSEGESRLKCFDYPDKIFDGKKYELHFNWTFSEGNDYFGNYSFKGDSAFDFNRLFIKRGSHSTKLKIGFEVL